MIKQKLLNRKKRALEICDRIFNESDNPSKARYFQQLVMCYSKVGDESVSINYALNALEMRKHLYHKFHPLIATSLNDTGTCYSNLGNEKKAMEYFNMVLELRLQISKWKSLKIANSYQTISLSYGKLGDENKANEYNKSPTLMQLKLNTN